MKVPADLLRQLPNIDVLVEQLDTEPEQMLSRAFPVQDLGLKEQIKQGSGLESLGKRNPDPLITNLREQWVEAGTRALKKIQRDGATADLQANEVSGLEAIVLIVGRPAILIQNGHFFPPPSNWQILEQSRNEIEKTCRSVGRIEVAGHPSLDWVGTGFLVARDVIMTNRHVAEQFCKQDKYLEWNFKSGILGSIDYVAELEATDIDLFHISDIIGVHDMLDLALFRVESLSTTGNSGPSPLGLASHYEISTENNKVYTIGYPARDPDRNDPEHMLRIFSNTFDVKRLQPGEIRAFFPNDIMFIHDCSTLGGNSGSCVVDLGTHEIIGLHFGGCYLKGNNAIALWQLSDDPLLKKANLNFT